MKEFGTKMIDVLFPPRCAICDEVVEVGETICENCKNGLPYLSQPVCLKCGKEVELEEQEYCKDCRTRERTFVRGYPVFSYIPPIVDSLMAYKYNGRQEYAIFYSGEIIKRFGNEFKTLSLDAVIPVPIHNNKYTTRGYNQAELIATPIAHWLGVPVITDLLSRDIDTLPQKELSRGEREKNMKGSFGIDEEALKDIISEGGRLRTVLLVDDIYTTGATIQACTELLLGSGSERVYYTSVAIGKGVS